MADAAATPSRRLLGTRCVNTSSLRTAGQREQTIAKADPRYQRYCSEFGRFGAHAPRRFELKNLPTSSPCNGAKPFIDPLGYARHRPEETLLYQLVERDYPELVTAREAAGRPLPKYVQEEFEAYLKCGRLKYGFLRVRCEDCRAPVLGVMHRTISAYVL